jgi:hypothetical protein
MPGPRSHATAKFATFDGPLDAEFNGSGGSFDSSDYRELKFIHVIRPRDLTKAQRANIDQWAAHFLDNVDKIYPQDIEFNSDYNAGSGGRERAPHISAILRRPVRGGLGVTSPMVLTATCNLGNWAQHLPRKPMLATHSRA